MGKVTGRQIALPDGRSAFVGQRDDGSSDYYVQLKNGTMVTRLKLTEEGALNLRKLLYIGDGAGEPAEFEVGDEVSTIRTWQAIKELNT